MLDTFPKAFLNAQSPQSLLSAALCHLYVLAAVLGPLDYPSCGDRPLLQRSAPITPHSRHFGACGTLDSQT